MDTSQIGLFDMAAQRLAWVDRRQALLAQNVANASTPGYQARDVPAFAKVLAGATPTLAVTDPMHIQLASNSGGALQAPRPRERAPDGNAVSLEDQLTKVADTASTQELVLNLYHKYQGMFRTALGRSG